MDSKKLDILDPKMSFLRIKSNLTPPSSPTPPPTLPSVSVASYLIAGFWLYVIHVFAIVDETAAENSSDKHIYLF